MRGEHLGARQGDVGVGPALAVGAGAFGQAQAVGVEAEVAARMEGRVRRPARGAPRRPLATKRAAAAAAEAEVGRVDVGRDDPERVAEQRQRLGDAAGGLERAAVVAAFARVGDAQAEARAVAERGDDLFFEPGGVDDDLAHAAARPAPRGATRSAACRAPPAAAWACVGERPHALAAAGGEDHRLHGASCTRRRAAALEACRSTDAGAKAAISDCHQRFGARRVVGAEVADIDVERRRLELGPGVDRQVRLGEQDDAGDAVGAAPPPCGAPARSDGRARRPALRPAAATASRQAIAARPASSSPAAPPRSRAGRRSGAGLASARLSRPGRRAPRP